MLATAVVAALPFAAQAQVEYFSLAAYETDTVNRTVVNFDGVATGTLLASNAFAGVTISARRVVAVNPQDFAPGLTVGGANVNSQFNGISASIAYSGTSLVFDNLDDNFTFTLATPSLAAGLWIGNVGASNNDPVTPTTVTFYAQNGSVITSEVFRQGHEGQIGTGANNRFFYGVVSPTPVAWFTVANGSGDFDGLVLDDVQWAAPVPEPGTALLLALGGLALAWRRRGSRIASAGHG